MSAAAPAAATARQLVVKIGGEIVGGSGLRAVADDVATLATRGERVFMVHGGGPQATALQRALGQEPRVVAGRRITDQAALDVMKMIVAGQVNVDLCAALVAAGARPVGLHGASSLVIEAVRRPPRVVSGGGAEPIDFGLVGDVVGFRRELLDLLAAAGYVPVLACLGADVGGQVLNINADIIANQLAQAMGVDHLVLVTGAPGVLRDIDDPTSRIPLLTAAQARAAVSEGIVRGGMIPKLEESLAVLDTGRVGSIHIVGDLAAGDLLRAIDQPGSIGTTLARG
ncbi:MAG TPA: acetylglutamate kinase [Kofleriaceae bacterium]|nr:acetylglutamate kinase [Kofleriaceae bacterium]